MKDLSRIESRHNPRFKNWKSWARHPEDKECPWVAIESWKTAAELSDSRPIQTLLCSDPQEPCAAVLQNRSRETHWIDKKLLSQLSSVQSFQGVVAFFEKPRWTMADLPSSILCLWGLQDPGNLGTLLRTARATGCGLVCGGGGVSCFNQKVIRASAAALFSTPFVEGVSLEEVKARGWRLVAATPSGGESLFEVGLEPPLAFLVGNEGSGLEPAQLDLAEARLHIPMATGSESLNAAIAGSLMLYEVYRRAGGRPWGDRPR